MGSSHDSESRCRTPVLESARWQPLRPALRIAPDVLHRDMPEIRRDPHLRVDAIVQGTLGLPLDMDDGEGSLLDQILVVPLGVVAPVGHHRRRSEPRMQGLGQIDDAGELRRVVALARRGEVGQRDAVVGVGYHVDLGPGGYLWRFYKGHRQAMRTLFERTVRTAVTMKLVDLAVQAVDGTKVVANASLNRSYDAEGLRGLLERLESAITDLEAQNEAGEDASAIHLPRELADKEVLREQVRQAMDDLTSQKRHKRINLTDPDARLMKGRQGIVAGYNAQAMVSPTETDGGATGMLVTAVDVVDAANDNALLVPMLEQAEETTGTKSQMTLADAGYFAASHLEECARRDRQVVVSESRQRFLKDPYHKDQFTYNEPSDSFTCPQGQTLKFVRIQHTNGVPLRLYRASEAVCQVCPAFGVCTRAKEIGRSLAIGPHDAVLRRHRAWMSTSAAREGYKLRKQLVEPVFGIVKEQQRARRFLLRGLVNVAAEWTMLATAFNLRTLWRVWRSSPFIGLFNGPEPCPVS